MKIRTTTTLFASTLALAAILAACGSTTVTVTKSTSASTPASTTSSATSSPSATTSASASSTSTSSTATASSSTATSTTAAPSTATGATTTTRTETAPAFVGTNPTSSAAIGHDLAAAIATLARRGYVPVSTATYAAGDTLRVLIGRRPGTQSEQAFFFDQTIYLGTDAAAPSQQISLLDENDTEVTLGYAIYSPGASAPSGRRAVSFELDMGQLSPLDALPSVAERR
jgi:hypothetical protein